MSNPTLRSIASRLKEALVEAAWIQWKALGLPASGHQAARSVVDAEALILASLWLQESEPRLGKLNRMFARHGSPLVSTQRLKNLERGYGEGAGKGLGEFALVALHESKDPRWRMLAQRGTVKSSHRFLKEDSFMVLNYHPPALMLRLRLGFSVSIKADALTFLIARQAAPASVPQISDAIGYQGRGVRRALEELAAADFIRGITTVPVSYVADEARWARFLGLTGSSPGWWYWHQLFTFGADLDRTAGETQKGSLYLQSSRARDVMERHQRLFALLPQIMTAPEKTPGESYLEQFAADIDLLASRIVEKWV